MTGAYLDDHHIYIYPEGVQVDITTRVMGDIKGRDWGIMGSGADDRVGSTGDIKLILNDHDGLFTPGSPTAYEDWDIGVPVELSITFNGDIYLYRFYVDDIKPPRTQFDIKTEVSCLTWMRFATRHPIQYPGIVTNQRANQALTRILEIVPTPPQAVEMQEGINIFPTILDVVTSTTKAYDEFVRIANSELGLIYLIHDRVFGETLVLENANARNGLRPLSILPLAEEDSGYLLNDTGGYLLNDTGGKLILSEAADAVFDNNMVDVEATYGRNVVNHLTVTASPRRLHLAAVILFQLDEPIALGSGQIVEIRGTYTEPTARISMNAQGMIDPVPTTDYLVNTARDGSGSNITTSLEFINIQYGTEGFLHRVRNTSATAGWLTKYNARGFGIGVGNPISHIAQDGVSMQEHGASTMTIQQKYKNTLYEGAVFAEAELFREKDPRRVIEKILFRANTSQAHMTAFLNLRPGSLARFVIDRLNTDGHYWIQGLDDISISTEGIIDWKYVLREHLSLLSGRLTMIAMEFGGSETEDGIFFGYLPHTANIQQRSYSFWINRADEPGGFDSFHMGGVTDVNGMGCYGHNDNDKAGFWVKTTGSQGTWEATTPPLSPGDWHHVVWTYDKLTPATAPKLYIDGLNVAVTQVGSMTGSVADETNVPFSIGNINTATFPYGGALMGTMKDCRVYNRILSAAEVITLENSGVLDESILTGENDGLVFQAMCVKTDELTDYIDLILEEDQYVVDNVYGAVGKPHDEPIARSL
jgi:hypothetical protein